MIKHFFLFLMLFLSIDLVYSQNRIIKGMVIDYSLEPLIGVDVVYNDSIKVGVTNVDGSFQIEVPLSVNNLIFRLVGVESANLKISDECNNVEVIMFLLGYYDFMSYRKVNKVRKKMYKELPKLHKEAYEKGIFQSPEPCYTRDFVEWTKERVP